MEVIHKIGRRKKAIARVYVSKGKGNITINDKDFKSYFSTGTLQYKVNQPLALSKYLVPTKVVADCQKRTDHLQLFWLYGS